MTNTTTPGFLTDAAPPMLLFGGKGGVGKTTTACATAFHLARANPDQRILLVSTDPAHSTSDALADAQLPENLRLVELDAGAEHERFMAEHATVLHEIASRGTFLDDADIEGFLELSLPGVDELMCFVRIADWLDTGEADRIVIDTAPTGHALRLLAMPHVLDGWLEAIDALLGKHRYMAGLFGGSGGSQTDAVENFVEDVTNKFAALAEAWSDEDACRFVPVCNAEPLSLSETSRLLDDLDTLDIDAPDIVVNRLVPLAGANDAAGDEEPGDEDPGLAARRVSQHAALHASLSEDQTPFDDRSLIAIPLLASEPRGAGLEDFFSAALPIDPAALQAGTASSDISPLPAVAGGIAPPAAAHRLVLTAGKGGVGKTTMAASLAAATAASDRPVLLVSTDPAGSLGDVFNAEVTDDPATLASNLRVMQIDAEVEFEALKEMYADELEAFMDNLSSAMDLAFDREALEHLLDLAPPGLDEVMAL
ncbi:MAG: TRC40/GET3/ArsA family transport-energizing ATPase, partial [Planctomycetota bacterium]